ncbi:Transcriptional regulator, GntR family domain / Aspartate aminotransferase [Alloactinosynnema sp. L-07]|uniref:MocR-like pyridoxine biosynthesis transcription factor PdxR n=1 Tax=Alloactinosynnema sp. L-07 TaxID=1653480 RepID=UPI00065EF903|nr:PLP-dependent aminotransferase family protein [Alloactinosynnema sp. L-07]CRK61610.1 Transcriptional regulator, GntR family domain / Aspartate aminotransferase [Alloactinosynnema sp. L-07]
MTVQWSTFRELLLPNVPETPKGHRGRTLEAALRAAIRDGRLPLGTRLPSTRDLAGQLGVARGTVTAAYAQLVAEGFLVTKHGSGTAVACTLVPPDPRRPDPAPVESWRYDLRPGLPALGAFPRGSWQAAARAGLAALSDDELGYPDPAGLPSLRAELVGYLGRVRAVDAGDVLITHGVAESLALLAQVLRQDGHREIAVEDPTHPGSAEVFTAHGLRPIGVPVDDEGLRVDLLARSGCRAVLVTAAHQFPLGVVLSARRRRELLAWARDTDGLVIEDDYDAEHRYDRPAVSATQALDAERVVYVGSVSKVLAPAVRLGWLVAPPELSRRLVTRKRLSDLGCSPLTQATFAQLLGTGRYDRHLRRTRQLYRGRRDALLDAVAQALPDWRAHGVAAGLHLVLRLPDGTDDRALSEQLAAIGINAPPLSHYLLDRAAPFPGLVVGYAATTPDRLRAAVGEIAAVTRYKRPHWTQG